MRILGIDVGSTSVKAVELDSAFGRFEIHEYHEHRVEPGTNPWEALQTLIQSLPKSPDKIAVSMRTHLVTFRNLQLPTKDKKAIQASVGFELDDDLPFPLENAVYDYTILSQVGSTTHLHAAATLKKHLELTLDQYRAAGIEPDAVTTEAWAYRTLLNRILTPGLQEKPVMLVQMGAERTTLYVHWKGFPILVRELSWGGRDLTTALANRYGVAPEQAETAKLDQGFVLSSAQRDQATQEQTDYSDTLLEPLSELLRDIRQAELTCKNLTHENISAIYLGGGTSLLPGLARHLEEELQLTVHPLQSLSGIAASGVTYSEHTDATFLVAVANALTLVGSDRASSINLRKGAYAKQGRSREINVANLKKPLAALALILLCFVTSLGVQSSVYQSRLKETDAQLERSVKSFFGQLSSSAVRTYMSNTNTLRSSINKELTKQRELNKLSTPNPNSPLNFLKTISATIPRETVVDLINYQVGAAPSAGYDEKNTGDASLTFLVSNPQMAEQLASILAGHLSGIQRSQMEEVTAPDGATKRWKITFSGKPTENSYGK